MKTLAELDKELWLQWIPVPPKAFEHPYPGWQGGFYVDTLEKIAEFLKAEDTGNQGLVETANFLIAARKYLLWLEGKVEEDEHLHD
jgi:hypothetical protein